MFPLFPIKISQRSILKYHGTKQAAGHNLYQLWPCLIHIYVPLYVSISKLVYPRRIGDEPFVNQYWPDSLTHICGNRGGVECMTFSNICVSRNLLVGGDTFEGVSNSKSFKTWFVRRTNYRCGEIIKVEPICPDGYLIEILDLNENVYVIGGWGSIPNEIVLRRISVKIRDDESILVDIMAWFCDAITHYLNRWGWISKPRMALISRNELCVVINNGRGPLAPCVNKALREPMRTDFREAVWRYYATINLTYRLIKSI